MDRSRLADFLRDSLALWQVPSEVETRDGEVWAVVHEPAGRKVAVERAPDGDPFRWYVCWKEDASSSERRRPCGSLVGVLAALRRAFGIERSSAIRIAPAADEDTDVDAAGTAASTPTAMPAPRRTVMPAAMVAANGNSTPLPPSGPTRLPPGARIPITILTGFLGSGKTTLLARLLRHPAMARTAVIVNEFGEIGLDHDLIETSDESFVQLSTGCLCCKLRSDLVATLSDLAVRRACGTVPAFERVLIETSGLADPAPILHALMTDRGLSEAYALDAVVTTVDTMTGAQSLERHPESARQVAVADTIVVTKVDLPQARAAEVEALVRRRNPEARILRAAHGDIEPAVLFEQTRLQTASSALVLQKEADGDEQNDRSTSRSYREIDASAHDHTLGIGTCAIVRESPVHAGALALFVSALAENCGAELLRVKGMVQVVERPEQPAVVEGVQHVYFPPRWLPRWPSPDRRTRLVFIGAQLRPTWLEALLDLLDAEVAEAGARCAV